MKGSPAFFCSRAGLQVCPTYADNHHMATQIFFIVAAVIVGGLAAFALELLLDR